MIDNSTGPPDGTRVGDSGSTPPSGRANGKVPSEQVEQDIMRLIADGQLRAARERVRESGVSPMFGDLVELDIRARLMQAGLSELQHLGERLKQNPDALSRLGPWLAAALAERMLLAGDPASMPWAMSLLGDVTDEPYPALPVLYGRARLRRIAAVRHTVEPSPTNVAMFRREREGAIQDFVRCGFHREVAATRAITSAYLYLTTAEDPWPIYDRIKRARAAIAGGEGSSWIVALEALTGFVALLVGDLSGAHAAWDETDSAAPHPLIVAHTHFGRAMANLIGKQATPASLAVVDQAIALGHELTPMYVPAFHYHVAHVLADFGRPQLIRYAPHALDDLPAGPISEHHRALLRIRVALATGEVPPAADVKAHLAVLEALHLRRQAGHFAVRIARDYERLDQYADAEALRHWGTEQLPRPQDRTLWELIWSQPLHRATGTSVTTTPEAPDRAPAGRQVAVSVIEPQLTVLVGDETEHLREPAAKLLLALVILHPQPLNIEQAADLLWPGLDLRRARTRLNTVVYRLRSTAPALSQAIGRTGDLLQLDDSCCAVDLLAYRSRLSGTTAERRQALLSVRSNLCAAQFPYDDLFINERHSFASTWLRHAQALIRAGMATPAELSPPASALGLDPDAMKPDG